MIVAIRSRLNGMPNDDWMVFFRRSLCFISFSSLSSLFFLLMNFTMELKMLQFFYLSLFPRAINLPQSFIYPRLVIIARWSSLGHPDWSTLYHVTLIFILNESTPFVRYIMEETNIGDEKRWSWRFHYHPSAMTKEDLIDCRERKGYATANNRYDLSV